VIGPLRLQLALVGTFLRAGGWPRTTLVVACTALVSGLLLVALTVVMFGFSDARGRESVSGLLTDSSVRSGYVFALLLICVAPLALLRQAIRLGTATRERRLAALRLAGATPAEVRRLGALEVGAPALLGGLLGYLVFGFLRVMLGGSTGGGDLGFGTDTAVARELRLVPVTVGPAWWHVVLIALAVALVGVLAGATTTRSMVISPLGVSRRAPHSAPRPWGILLMLVAVPLFVTGVRTGSDADDLFVLGSLTCLFLGLLALAPWVAYRAGKAVASRAATAPVLMAGRRLTSDARPAGRAAAAVGAIATVAGGGGALLADLPATSGRGAGFRSVDPFYTVPIALAGIVLVAALLLIVFSMAVHGVESLIDHKRSVASLTALGASTQELERTQRWEVGLVALPMAVIGLLIGSGPMVFLLGANRYAWIPLLVDAAIIVLAWLAVRGSTRLTRPWLVRASSPANLRTA
jgi:hypothetical protein